MRRRMLPGVAALALSLAACGTGATTPAPTTTVAPTVAPESSRAAGESAAAGEPLDLVLLADSGGWGIAEKYAALAAEALDREVRVHDHTVGGQTASQILSGIRGSWSEDVASAEIILFYVHPGGPQPPSMATCLQALDAVGGDPDYLGPAWSPGMTWDPPEVTTAADWQRYRDDLDRVYDAIRTLREGRPTILRAYGIWNPWLAPWREVGIEQACNANQDVLDQVRREAAEANGAVFVSLLDIFNGPTHDEDPVIKGWIEEDGMHANDQGQAIIAEALAAVGFEASEAPR